MEQKHWREARFFGQLTGMFLQGTEGTEKTFPRMARMNSDQTKLVGSISATISEIRGESDREFFDHGLPGLSRMEPSKPATRNSKPGTRNDSSLPSCRPLRPLCKNPNRMGASHGSA